MSGLPDAAEGRHLYGEDPAAYAAGRPEYPPRVYELLVERCELRAGVRVVEIGPGTGLVTRHLLDAGAHVTAVEPNAAMARFLEEEFSHQELEVIVAPFEHATLPAREFDLAVAATSFHWVEREQGLCRLQRIIRPDGWVAIWWMLFEDPNAPDALSSAVERIVGPPPYWDPDVPPFQLDARGRRAELADAGFVDVDDELVRHVVELDAFAARALYASMAVVLRLPPAERAHVLDAVAATVEEQPGGRLHRQFVTAMYTAHQRPNSAVHE
jgi:SAM-dependent methyltransferase